MTPKFGLPCSVALVSQLALISARNSALAEPIPQAMDDTYYVMKQRQKYIDLRAFLDHFGEIWDPDEFVWTITVPPPHGYLFPVRGSTLRYVPLGSWTGVESFTFSCKLPGSLVETTATVRLETVDAFVAPFGLAEPDFGIEENWDDYSRPPGNIYPVNLTNNEPIPTILNPGDVVELQGEQPDGPAQGPLIITANGTCDAPIFIRGAHALWRATLLQGLRIKGDYVIIENIDFDASEWGLSHTAWVQVTEKNSGPIIVMDLMGMESEAMSPWPDPEPFCPIAQSSDSTHIVVRHCSFLDHPSGMVPLTELGQSGGVAAMLFGATHSGSTSPNNGITGVSNCVVYDTFVANFGNWDAQCVGEGANRVCPKDYGALGFEGNSQYMWCLDSVFHHIQGTGVSMSRNNALSYQSPSSYCYAGRNVIHHVLEFPFNIKFTRNSIITQNKLYRVRKADSTNRGTGVSIDNDDHCNSNVNLSGYYYSDNVWVIFNHMYDMQTGVATSQQIHCGEGLCCCPGAPGGGGTGCCSAQTPFYEEFGSTVYVVGNIFNHIQPYGLTTQAQNYGQAVEVGLQTQMWVTNNTIANCAQGVTIDATHSTGQCPTEGDPNNVTRSTRVGINNNIILNTVDDGDNDSHVRVSTGPYPGNPTYPSTLTQYDFDFNLHFEQFPRTMYVKLPILGNNFCPSVLCLRNYLDPQHLMGWAANSFDDRDPVLANPAELDFRATANSNFGQLGKPNDLAYSTFQSAWGRSIYHDYEGKAYNSTTCSFGAFADPDY